MNQTYYSESKICRVCENEENLLNLLNDTTDNLIEKLKSFVDFDVSKISSTFGGVVLTNFYSYIQITGRR